MKKNKIKIFLAIMAVVLSLILALFLIRAFSEVNLDDVSPGIDCKKELLEESDILWIIPKFEGTPISENKEWCENIQNLNKTLGIHGITHEYHEFLIERDKEYLEEGINIFEECFGYKPTMFKPPQLKISEKNKELIKKSDMELKLIKNQVLHKGYHCGEYGEKRNWIISLI